jgi:hypothetical protein
MSGYKLSVDRKRVRCGEKENEIWLFGFCACKDFLNLSH